jgi:hypothetical protein
MTLKASAPARSQSAGRLDPGGQLAGCLDSSSSVVIVDGLFENQLQRAPVVPCAASSPARAGGSVSVAQAPSGRRSRCAVWHAVHVPQV